MKKSSITLLVGALLILILAQTNPDLEDHRSALKSHVMDQAGNTIFKGIKRDSGLNNLGNLLGSALIDKMIDMMVTRDNYLLFSLTKVKYDGENKIVGVGVLGNVFMTSGADSKISL
jgi:hypothetical protein